MSDRTPAKPKPTHAKRLKHLHKKHGKDLSLKEFVRTSAIKEVAEVKDDWFHNKRANFSNLPLKIGNTGRKKGSGSGKKPKGEAKTKGDAKKA